MNVLITGGTGALGAAVTKRFVDEGHNVSVTWVVEGEAERLERELGPHSNLHTVQANVLDPDSVEAAVTSANEKFGKVEALVHLVGAYSGGKLLHEHDLTAWRKMLDLNLTSAFLLCRAVLPGMLEQNRGRIVLVSSRNSIKGRKGQAPYAIAKAGVSVLAEAIAEETKGTDVTANVIAPSTIDTKANREAMPDADFDSWVTPQQVAATISFLASKDAIPLRGAWLPVFGGA